MRLARPLSVAMTPDGSLSSNVKPKAVVVLVIANVFFQHNEYVES